MEKEGRLLRVRRCRAIPKATVEFYSAERPYSAPVRQLKSGWALARTHGRRRSHMKAKLGGDASRQVSATRFASYYMSSLADGFWGSI